MENELQKQYKAPILTMYKITRKSFASSPLVFLDDANLGLRGTLTKINKNVKTEMGLRDYLIHLLPLINDFTVIQID